MRFTISTWSDTKSNRRDRTYVVEAATALDAINLATVQANTSVRHNVTIVCSITDVDGNGPPVDCPHDDARKYNGFKRRADGGLDCRSTCAE